MSIPCCLCSKCKGCDESFLCTKAFGIRIGLSLLVAAALVVIMNMTFPRILATLSPDSYSVTGHPMDEIAPGADGGPGRADHGEALIRDTTPERNPPAQDS